MSFKEKSAAGAMSSRRFRGFFGAFLSEADRKPKIARKKTQEKKGDRRRGRHGYPRLANKKRRKNRGKDPRSSFVLYLRVYCANCRMQPRDFLYASFPFSKKKHKTKSHKNSRALSAGVFSPSKSPPAGAGGGRGRVRRRLRSDRSARRGRRAFRLARPARRGRNRSAWRLTEDLSF